MTPLVLRVTMGPDYILNSTDRLLINYTYVYFVFLSQANVNCLIVLNRNRKLTIAMDTFVLIPIQTITPYLYTPCLCACPYKDMAGKIDICN